MAIKTINVTQLKYSCLDPVWRKKWIEGKKPTTKSFTPLGKVVVYGMLFHKIAEKFVGFLINSKKISNVLDNKDSLWQEMYEGFAEKELTKLLKTGKIDL